MGTSAGYRSQATEKKLGDDQVRGGRTDRRADERASRGADGLLETEGAHCFFWLLFNFNNFKNARFEL